MLNQADPKLIEKLLREVSALPPFPPAIDRKAWGQVLARLGDTDTNALIHLAETAAGEPIPPLPASLWLECLRTGERAGYEMPCYRRRLMLRDLVLGECLEHQGRFHDALVNAIWAICEESSWVYPAHHPALPDVDQPYIDLGAASTGYDLALVDGLLGPDLPGEVGRRIRAEVNKRLLVPYLAREDFWWLHGRPGQGVNNWTAVCNAGVMAAAIYLEPDAGRLAAILAKGMRSLDDYLATFDEDGGTSEGPGYWSYGFGFFTLIAQLIEQRTDGRLSLVDGELVRKIASFPLRTMMSPGLYVNFSDAPREATFTGAMLVYLGRRLDVPGLIDLARAPANQERTGLNGDLVWQLPSLFWDVPEPVGPPVIPDRHDWYSGMMWMIARFDPGDPDGLALAAKGGHNDEMHNHNDVGSFIVQVNQEALVADLGAGRYTLQYFGDGRYDLFVPSSMAHSVPAPNGHLQKAGRQYAARLLEHRAGEDVDVLRLNLRDAYPVESGLESLQRRLALHRAAHPAGAKDGWVELEDRFAFSAGPGNFESAIMTFCQVTQAEGAVTLTGERGSLRVFYEPEQVDARVEVYEDVDLAGGPSTVHRVVFFTRGPRRSGAIRLEFVPLG